MVAKQIEYPRNWLPRTCLRTGLFAAIFGVVCGPTSTAHARNPDRDDLPWSRGTLVPSLGLGGSFGGDIGQLGFGVGASYFVANGLGIGLGLYDQIWFYSSSLQQTYPGIKQQLPTNEFSIRPNIQYIFFRNRYFSPYAVAGIGPVFLNHGGGTLGEWQAGPGFYIGLGGPVFLNLGVVFSGRIPGDACREAYTYRGPDSAAQFDTCGWGWGIRGGLVFALGLRKKQSPPPPAPRYQPAEPAPSYQPLPAPGYQEPASTPSSEQPAGQPPASGQPPVGQPPASGQPPVGQPSPGGQPQPSQPPTEPSVGQPIQPTAPVDPPPTGVAP